MTHLTANSKRWVNLPRSTPWYKSRLLRRGWYFIVVYALLLLGAALFMVPFVWMISTSLKEPQQVYAFPPQWIPDPVRWQNYPEGWTKLPYTLFLRNTLIITLHNMVADVFSSALVAFSFARLRARGRNFLFMLVLATMMVPNEVRLIPVYILFARIGWVNTFLPLMVPSWFAFPFFVFLLRQFFMTIPYDLDDAARIDGCNTWMTFGRIILPLAKPALTAVAIFSFVSNWNDFLQPLIFLSDLNLYTLAIGLNMLRGQYYTLIHLMMAVSVIVVIPILVIFFAAQKYFIQGVTLTGIKG